MTRSRLGEGENIGRNILWDARDGNGNPPSFLLGYLMRLGINLTRAELIKVDIGVASSIGI